RATGGGPSVVLHCARGGTGACEMCGAPEGAGDQAALRARVTVVRSSSWSVSGWAAAAMPRATDLLVVTSFEANLAWLSISSFGVGSRSANGTAGTDGTVPRT